jgi:hypothetical protein
MEYILTPQHEQYACLMMEIALLACCFAPIVVRWGLCAVTLVLQRRIITHRVWQLTIAVIATGIVSVLVSGWLAIVLCLLSLGLQHALPIPAIRRKTAVPIGRSSHVLVDPLKRDNVLFDETDKRTRHVVISTFYPCQTPKPDALRAELFDSFDVVGQALIKVLPAVPNWMAFLTHHVNG